MDHLAAVARGRARLAGPIRQTRNCVFPHAPTHFVQRLLKRWIGGVERRRRHRVDDAQAGVVPARQAHGLFECAARALREIHADENGL